MIKTKLKLGDTFQSTSGNTFSIIELLPDCKSKVKFNDEFGYEVVVNNTALRKGTIKNPYYRKLFGKGYFGVGPYKSKLGPGSQGYPNTKEYMAWINMLSRCYYDKYTFRTTGNKVYDDAEVCDEWLNFQTFAKWFTEKYMYTQLKEKGIKVALDKDILGEGSKLYSPETCSLVPVEINAALIGCSKVMVGKHSVNPRLLKNGTYSINLISFDKKTIIVSGLKSKEECLNEYMKQKKLILIELAKKYKHIIESNVYEKLTESWDKFLFKSPVGLV